MRVDPSNPHQRTEFELELAEQFSLGATGLRRASELLNEMARSRDGREYLSQNLGAQAFTTGGPISLDASNARQIAHELTHVMQQSQGRVRR